MKAVIAMGKKTYFIMKTLLIKRNELTGMNIESSLHSAVLPIAHDGDLRRNTLVNPESAFTRLKKKNKVK